ncbi:class I SAM-dependent methyltransferase [Kitasatospora sp. NPDC059571]|uniref:class I SAM-dependent methyltransferase n=1 Tax=Kitasatospora sp. NPDC059571 TaxID=3346871 RepID=UPI00367AFBCB
MTPAAEDLHATRDAYDSVAVLYSELFATELASRPLDRAMLDSFAELVQAGGGGPVGDLGCGPGWVTAYLRGRGADVFGVDLSPAMVGLARQAYPDLAFGEGTLTALDIADGTLGGVVARYSIIHLPPEQVPAAAAEFHRVLAPGGHLLVAFQADPEPGAHAFDHKVATAYRWSPDTLAGVLRGAGLVEVARLVREPGPDERSLQAYLLARRPRTV